MKNLFKGALLLMLLSCFISTSAQYICQSAFSYTIGHDTVSFNNTSAHTSNTGASYSFEWEFGDGTTSTDSCCPIHVYSDTGTYTVCLVMYTLAQNTEVCGDSTCQEVHITSLPATTCGSINGAWTYSQVSPTDTIHFTSAVDSTDWGCTWTFGDGGVATGGNPVHYFSQPGTYTVCRYIEYNNGACHDTVCQTVTVHNYCATLTSYWLDSVVSGSTYRFYASDTNSIANHYWKFGDGSPEPNSLDTTHTYTSNGTYTACLYVYIPGSTCPTDSYCRTITVTGATGCASINGAWTYSQGAPYDTIYFSYAVDSTDWSNEWTFGDGGSSTYPNPAHYYSQAGTYTVCRYITYNNGTCHDTVCQTVTVRNYCSGIITTWTDSIGTGNTVTFLATDTVAALHRDWKFGDGTEGFGESVTHTYSATGTYNVCLITYVPGECTDSSCANITISGDTNCSTINGAWTYSQVTNFDTVHFTMTVDSTDWYNEWNFGDGGGYILTTGTNIVHYYSQPGTYTVCRVIEYGPNHGCRDTVCQSVTVTNPCSGLTGYWLDSLVSGSTYRFYATDTNANASFRWTFGDGTVAYSKDTTHSYSAGGTYTVCLYVSITGTTCPTDSYCRTITVAGNTNCPSINGAWTYSQVSGTDTVHFTSTVDSTDWYTTWTFGDGGTSTAYNPVHYYTQPGTYTVCRIILYHNQSCHDTVCQSVTVTGCGTAAFEYYVINGDEIRGYSTSTGTSSNTDYGWTIKNSSGTVVFTQLSDTNNCISQPLANGTYTLCLTLYNGNMRCDSVCEAITVFDRCTNLNANWTYYQTTNGTDSIQFNSTVDSTTWTYLWTFGDGTTSYYPNLIHHYSQPGTYTVCHIVGISSLNCYDTICQSVTVTGSPHCGTAVISGYIYGYNSIHAFDTATNNPSGTIYYWTIYGPNGDLIQSESSDTNYILSGALTNGTYTVCLRLYTANNLFCDSVCTTFTITNSTVCSGLSAAWSQSYLQNGNVKFTPADSSASVSYYWVFGDGTTSTDISPTHAYANGGLYHVCLYVSYPNTNCTDSSCANIQASGSGCSASFTYILASNANYTVDFTNTSTSTDSITTYGWGFGDGTSSTSKSPSHTYDSAGTYYVCMYIVASNGCTSSYCDSVTVTGNPCAGFNSYWTSNVLQNGNIQFHAYDTSSAVHRYWTFGDGTSATGSIDPVHAYANPGTYTVCLYDYIPGTTCVDSTCTSIVVASPSSCAAGFTYQSYYPPYNSVNFTNTSTSNDSIISYYWTFGDNTSGTFKNGSHTYPHSGYWYTCLTITTLHGCTSTYCDSVFAQYDPCYGMSASYTYSYTNNGGVQFVPATNTNANFNLWIFGDGTTSTGTDPIHYYNQAGTYTVCHITGIQGSCADTSCQTIQGTGSGTGCQANFTYTTDTSNNNAYFTNTSTSSDSIISYSWTFGDGGTSDAKNPYHIYANAGTYYVCLTIATDNGCSSTYCDSVKVRVNTTGNPCVASFTDALDTCQTLAFTNTSTGGYTREYWNFGDGSTYDTAADPTHLFPVGTWVVKLEIFGTNCQSTDTEVVTVAACGNTGNDTICGVVFNDLNGNGVQNTGETGVPNAEIHIGSFVTHTDSSGHYQIIVPAGTYTIYYCAPDSYTFTIPVNSISPNTNTTCSAYQNVVISSGSNCGFNFGILINNVTICGTVYFDANDNHVQDPGESGIPNILVTLTDSATGATTNVYTNQYGEYCAVVPAGTYVIGLAPGSYGGGTVYPTSIRVDANTAGGSYGDNNFGIYTPPGDCDLTITVKQNTNVTPGYPAWYDIEVCNVGSSTASAQVNMFYDPKLTWNYASPAPASQNPTTFSATWDLNNLLPGSCQYYWISLQADSTLQLGESIFTLVNVIPTTCNDTNTNNIDTLHQVVMASWDPNNKTVSPPGEGPDGLIKVNQPLTYTINFQNTGTAPAVNVVIHDTLSTNLDLSTFKMVGASAPYSLQFTGNVAVWKFSGIMLPDSAADPQGSTGFVSYSILPLQTLKQGAQINNTATVFFDYNAGSNTNTTLNTIDYNLAVTDVAQSNVTITLQPNPFNAFTVIRIQGSEAPYEMKIYNMMGQLVGGQTAEDNTILINRNSLASGVYMYQIVKNGTVLGEGKMVAQ